MTDLQRYLRSKPWWNARFMWGGEATKALVWHAVWHSRFTLRDVEDLEPDSLV